LRAHCPGSGGVTLNPADLVATVEQHPIYSEIMKEEWKGKKYPTFLLYPYFEEWLIENVSYEQYVQVQILVECYLAVSI
jgi:hypothetical protein